ncbi:TraB/GumN family protein [Pararhodonellum marinum]|uniref:TraB/GumN family protein n=1 Tax=Pararhodonellum marinum TaxID=2755358 RepID=UPI00188F5201|nr:TraB/GumN family protein [Pararhodonellum marinum]
MKKHMLKSIMAGLLLVISVSHTHAQEQHASSLLWKITGNGLESPSYLFGTIHVICKDQFIMDERITEALESSEKLAMELDMSDPNLVQEMQMVSFNPDMQNIQEEFEPEHREAVNKFLSESYGAGLDQMGVLKPFVLSSMILMKQLPCADQSSYEMYFVEKAKNMEMPVVGLETIQFQVGIFDEIPQKLQIDELGKMVTNQDSMKEFERMVTNYTSENLDELYQVIAENDLFKEYGDLLLTKRNENWISKIQTLIHDQPTFIAVGAGHLPAEDGVIQLLRTAGYAVEAVR